jgi:hypothetical protein
MIQPKFASAWVKIGCKWHAVAALESYFGNRDVGSFE